MDSSITLEVEKKMNQKVRITKIQLLGIRGQFESIAEGQYFYKFKYRLTKDYPWQVSYIPVKIDNTAPKIISIDFSNPEKIKLIAKGYLPQGKGSVQERNLICERPKRTS